MVTPVPFPSAAVGWQPALGNVNLQHVPGLRPLLLGVQVSNKRRGPLPLFLAQLLVLAAYGGLGFLAFKKDEETRKALAIVLRLIQTGYSKVQKLLPSSSKS